MFDANKVKESKDGAALVEVGLGKISKYINKSNANWQYKLWGVNR